MPKRRMYKSPTGWYEKKATVNGKRVSVRGKTEAEVLAKIANIDKINAAGEKFTDAAQIWLEKKETEVSPTTIGGYRVAAQRAADYFGTTRVSRITPGQIQIYLDKLAAQGYSRSTVQHHFVVLREILQAACVRNNLPTNPATVCKLPSGLRSQRRTMPTAEQLEQIKALDNDDGRFYRFLMYSGLRLGEALALQYKDVQGDYLIVNKSAFWGSGNQAQIKPPKTANGNRRVICSEKIKTIVDPFKRNPEAYIFGGDKPLSKKQYYNMVARMKAAGITVTPHQLRHAYATLLFENGVDVKTAQALLGHAQISTTMDIYTELRDKQLDKVVDILRSADF